MGNPLTIADILDRLYKPKKKEIIPTGFSKLDDILDGGFAKQEMIVIGGGTGVGKSFFAGQMALSMAKKGYSAVYFSLELSAEMIVARMLGAEADIKPTRILWGLLTEEEQKRKEEAIANLMLLSDLLIIYDEVYQFGEITAKIRQHKPEVVFIDFVQNVIVPGQNDEYSRLSLLSVSLQKLAKEMNTCIILLSQLSNRIAREGEDARYLEYKGAGTIAQVADLGFWLLPGADNYKVLALRKNRRGPSFKKINLRITEPGGKIIEL